MMRVLWRYLDRRMWLRLAAEQERAAARCRANSLLGHRDAFWDAEIVRYLDQANDYRTRAK